MNWQDRITIDPQVLVGKPIIKGTRISVEHVVKLMADGWSEADVLRSYPHLKPDDLRARASCLHAALELKGVRS